MKMRHNKKRNTAFIYETLISELTQCSLNKDEERRGKIVSLIKEHFRKGTVLNKELAAYMTLLESEGLEKDVATRLVAEARRVHSVLDKKEIFRKQTELISEINKNLSNSVFSNFVNNYKNLNTIGTTHTTKLSPKIFKLIDKI